MQDIVSAYKNTAVDLLKDPDSPEALTNQFILLSARGQKSPAHLALAKRCERIAPQRFIAVFNLASAQLRAGCPAQSIQSFTRALDLADKSQQAITLTHIGLAWYAAGDPHKALEWYGNALAHHDDKDIRQSIAIAKLMAGDLTAMFDFECRYHTPRRKPVAQAGIPRWAGQDLTGKTIIVAHEQGFGDTIQFSRFIPRIKAKRVIWSGPESISGLIVDNFDLTDVQNEEGPFKADYYCSPISACGAMKVDYAQVDPSPYITAKPIKLPERGRLKIGLAWAGNADYAHDEERSMALRHLMPLLEVPGTAFYSLQVGRGETEISKLGLDGMIANLGATFKDWRDTARAIAALDLVVAVDTGAAHLAGAMGKPVFVLLPYANCWRWMRDRTDTPWYSSARLCRQVKPRDWSYPVGTVKDAIERRLDG